MNAQQNTILSPKTITLSGSIKFVDVMDRIAEQLALVGFEVLHPVASGEPEFAVDAERAKAIRHRLIKEHLAKIDQSVAVLVVNPPKNQIDNYIGVSTLGEMMYAFGTNKPIFILNQLPTELDYAVDLAALESIELKGDLTKLITDLGVCHG
jgi:hypothetical protein